MAYFLRLIKVICRFVKFAKFAILDVSLPKLRSFTKTTTVVAIIHKNKKIIALFVVMTYFVCHTHKNG